MIAISSDHAAVKDKQRIIEHLEAKGLQVKDLGAYDEKIRVDYPDYAESVAKSIKSGESRLGILLCGTGIGMSIAANKIEGIRCAHCCDTFSARMAREHNDSNMIALGANITGGGLMIDIVDAFLTSSFSGEERHKNRIEKICKLEKVR